MQKSDRDKIKDLINEWEEELADWRSYNGPTMPAERDLAQKIEGAKIILKILEQD